MCGLLTASPNHPRSPEQGEQGEHRRSRSRQRRLQADLIYKSIAAFLTSTGPRIAFPSQRSILAAVSIIFAVLSRCQYCPAFPPLARLSCRFAIRGLLAASLHRPSLGSRDLHYCCTRIHTEIDEFRCDGHKPRRGSATCLFLPVSRPELGIGHLHLGSLMRYYAESAAITTISPRSLPHIG
jgi:hypothetical protein